MREKLLVSGAGLILIYLAWAWGGLQQDWLMPAVWGTVILLAGLLATSFQARHKPTSRTTPWWRDVFFYAGLLFLGYLGVQWWNAGRVLFFDVGIKEWRYSLPRHPGWPSAFSKPEAAQMLTWFFPAWVMGLIVRSPLVGKQALLGMLRSLVYGAGLLSVVGIVQFLTHAQARYWIRPTDDFFASFGYTNHAAAFFVLMGALGAGLLFRELFPVGGALRAATRQIGLSPNDIASRSAPPTGRKHLYRTHALAASLLLCLVGANLSLSRAGVILAWALAAFVSVYGLAKGWCKLQRAARVNLAAATVAALFVFYFAVAGFGEKEILHEFEVKKPIHHRLCPALDKVNLALSDRPLLAGVAWQMWQDNPAFGVGGWGFRHLLALYLPEEKWTYVQYPGRANVHCDGLQFLAEFGAVGFGLMVIGVSALMVSLFRNTNRKNPVWIMGLIGLLLVAIHSLIDLPFRCPAILCAWVVVLAALPKITEVRSQNSQ